MKKILILFAALAAVGCTKKETATTAVDDGYPLATCVVSGEKLGEMGAPYVLEHEGKTVKLCCDGCEEDFKKDPAKFISKIYPAP
jgi:YHS domain-containing protein